MPAEKIMTEQGRKASGPALLLTEKGIEKLARCAGHAAWDGWEQKDVILTLRTLVLALEGEWHDAECERKNIPEWVPTSQRYLYENCHCNSRLLEQFHAR